MRPGLPHEVEQALVRLGGEATAREIAQHLGASAADVARVLRGGRFSGPWLRGRAPQVRRVYKLAGGPQGARGVRVQPHTQTGRVLDLLSDGEWHSTRDVLRHVPCIVHSRIASLRERGYRIEHRGSGGGSEAHEYRLLGTLTEPDQASEAPSGSGSLSAAGLLPSSVAETGVTPLLPVALTLFDEAAA